MVIRYSDQGAWLGEGVRGNFGDTNGIPLWRMVLRYAYGNSINMPDAA